MPSHCGLSLWAGPKVEATSTTVGLGGLSADARPVLGAADKDTSIVTWTVQADAHLEGDADALAGAVEGRAAAVAAVDGGVDLHAQQLAAAVHVRRNLDAADHAGGDRLAVAPDGIAARESRHVVIG